MSRILENSIFRFNDAPSTSSGTYRALLLNVPCNRVWAIQTARDDNRKITYHRGPKMFSLGQIELSIDDGRVEIDTYIAPTTWLLSDEQIEARYGRSAGSEKCAQLSRRDRAWHVIEPIVSRYCLHDLLELGMLRSAVGERASELGVKNKIILAILHRYWAGASNRNALLGSLSNCGGKGKIRSQARKLGRPNVAIRSDPSASPGYLLSDIDREQLQFGWETFLRPGVSVQAAYLRTMEAFYRADTEKRGNALIYAAVDAALGTDYFRQYSAKKWSVETHMVVVAQLLFNSFCGVLIVEEIQLRNFQSDASRNLMLLFFLRLCNLGIPIVLIGNPIGFEGFEDFSQDVRRMSSGGAFELWPATSSSDVEWVEFVVPGMLRFNILPKPPRLVDAAELLFGFTGGICDFLAKLLIQAQLLALRSGKDHLGNDEVVAAFRSPVMRSSHALIRGLVERDVNALSKFLDVPALSFASMWDSELDPVKPVKGGSSSLSAAASAKMALTQGADIASKGGRARSSAKAPRFVTAAATFQAKKTSAERRKRKAEELRASLSPEDVRADGRQNVLLGNFHELKKQKGS